MFHLGKGLEDQAPGDQFKALKVLRAWKQCAGPALMQNCRFHGIQSTPEGLILRLEVPDPVWRQEIQFELPKLLEMFNRELLRLGIPAAELPRSCQLLGQMPVPRGTRRPQFGWNK